MRILVVDDHPIVVSGIRLLLADDAGSQIVEARSSAEGLAAFAEQRPDVAVIDINLPDLSGFELTRRILDKVPGAQIIVFSMNDDPTFALRALDSGARGYVSKNDDPAEFRRAILDVAAGRTYLAPGMAERIETLRRAPAHTPEIFSLREREILRLLAKGKSMQEIANLVGLSYKTVAATCAAMRQKLDARTPVELVRIALEQSQAVPAGDERELVPREHGGEGTRLARELAPELDARESRGARLVEAGLERDVVTERRQVVVGPADGIDAKADRHDSSSCRR